MCYVSYYYRAPCFYRSRCGLRIFFQLIFNRGFFMFYIILLLAIVAGTIFFAFVGCMIDNMFELIIQKMDAKN